MVASPLRKCPKCSKMSLKRLIGTGAGIIFKGSGFYQTDYRTDSYTQAAKKETDSGTNSTKTEAKSEKSSTDPAKKSETKTESKPKEKKKTA
ncbi:MAG: zinc ribbon domain-containing protein [Phycisphaerae bacterium]|nr:zinc ribbon domain-containing protein [Phycisphaerae bacterium]